MGMLWVMPGYGWGSGITYANEREKTGQKSCKNIYVRLASTDLLKRSCLMHAWKTLSHLSYNPSLKRATKVVPGTHYALPLRLKSSLW